MLLSNWHTSNTAFLQSELCEISTQKHDSVIIKQYNISNSMTHDESDTSIQVCLLFFVYEANVMTTVQMFHFID